MPSKSSCVLGVGQSHVVWNPKSLQLCEVYLNEVDVLEQSVVQFSM